MLDYIIVGFGLAGMSFAEQLRKDKKRFVVINDHSQQSSRVAGGLYNPVILKRFTLAWDAALQLKKAIAFYSDVESYLGANFNLELPVVRRFNSVEEQNLWMEAIDKPGLKEFLSDTFIKNTNTALDVPYQYGLVNQTGRIAVKKLLEQYLQILQEQQQLLTASFVHKDLRIAQGSVHYKNIEAKHIVFCEGYGMVSNPYFKNLPLVGNKGEYITIKAPTLQLTRAFKAGIFILPLGNNLYKVGATYNNQDQTPETTTTARDQLIQKLEQVLKVPYTIVSQEAGIRPTVKDRKPLVGTHPSYKNVHLLNGFGSRGIMIGPYISEQLYVYIENQTPLDKQIDLRRFL